MNLTIEIDPRSGFCNGVVRAIRQAENYLDYNNRLYSLGAIVHNTEELERLKKKGLEILSIDGLEQLHNDVILVRAHGEPPSTYALARRNGLQVIDCTCPVVLKLQERVRETWQRLRPLGGQVLIFGKKGHAEVNGLVGQTDGEAIVIGSVEEAARLDYANPVALFSQTTKDPLEFARISEYVRGRRPTRRSTIPSAVRWHSGTSRSSPLPGAIPRSCSSAGGRAPTARCCSNCAAA